jgi:type III secretion protein U
VAEKTEKATPKKLQDARKKGQIARSQDAPAVVTFAVSMAATLSLAPSIYDQLTTYIRLVMSKISTVKMDQEGPVLMIEGIRVIFMVSFPIVAIVAFCGALANFFMVGPLLTFEVFKFNIKKFDPIQNLKQKFKLKTFVELLKSMVKISVAGYLCYKIAMNGMDLVISAIGQPVWVSLEIISHFLKDVLIQVGLFFVFVSAFDLFYQKHTFEKEMMMEKFEIKQEYKNTEGDPEIKGKRKEIAREIAYGGGPMSPKGAKALITNPIHLAIAIGYEDKYPAPFIMSKGSGADAAWLIKEAEKLDIPILRNIYLARQLFDTCEEFSYVPVDTYEAIAEILKWVATLKPLENQQE